MSYTLREAASLLRVDSRTLRRWMERMFPTAWTDPDDGRRRLLTDDQVVWLATQHNRPDVSRKIRTDGHTLATVTLTEPTDLEASIKTLEDALRRYRREMRTDRLYVDEQMEGLGAWQAETQEKIGSIIARLEQIEE